MNDATENPAYEASDASVPKVLVGIAVFFGGIVFSLVVAAFVYRSGLVRPSRDIGKMSFKHGPENESTIVRDWREQDKLVREHLDNYAWADREKGLVRIPIARAMELMAQDAGHPAQKKP